MGLVPASSDEKPFGITTGRVCVALAKRTFFLAARLVNPVKNLYAARVPLSGLSGSGYLVPASHCWTSQAVAPRITTKTAIGFIGG